MKRLILILLIISIFLMCASCDKTAKETAGNENEVVTTDYQGMTIIEEIGMKNVFSATRISMPSDSRFYNMEYAKYYFDRCFIMNGRIYFACEYFDSAKKGYVFVYFYSYDFNGENDEYVLVEPVNENAEVKFAWYDSEYNMIVIEELNYRYTLTKFNGSHEIIFSVELDNIINNSTVLSMVVGDKEDNIYIASSDNKVTVFSKDGEVIWRASPKDTVLQLSSAHGKTPVLRMRTAVNVIKYQYIDSETKTLKDIEMPHNIYGFMYSYLIYGEGYDYYHVTPNGVYGYDIASNTLTKVLDWNNSDLMFSQLTMIAAVSPEKMFIGENDWSDYKYKIYILDHIPNDEVPKKTYISIGYINYYDDTYLTQAVAFFNKNNPDYRITLTNYCPKDGNTDLTFRLNTEIAAGNTPDLLYINGNIPMLHYTRNGLFVDLFEYLAGEPELYNNLLPFVTESVKINNKLPQMITKFTIKTLRVRLKTSAAGQSGRSAICWRCTNRYLTALRCHLNLRNTC